MVPHVATPQSNDFILKVNILTQNTYFLQLLLWEDFFSCLLLFLQVFPAPNIFFCLIDDNEDQV